MKTIWQYTIETLHDNVLEIPKGGQVLSIQIQGGLPQLWVLIDPNAEKGKRTFRLHGTGHGVPDSDKLNFIGTVQLDKGELVLHVFEVL